MLLLTLDSFSVSRDRTFQFRLQLCSDRVVGNIVINTSQVDVIGEGNELIHPLFPNLIHRGWPGLALCDPAAGGPEPTLL